MKTNKFWYKIALPRFNQEAKNFMTYFLRLTLLLIGLFFMTNTHALEIYAHRGASSLLAEGTIPAYIAAIRMRADVIDMDIALTKDNIVVVNHDQRLSDELTRDKEGHWLKKPGPYIRELTFAELQAYDVGAINPKSALAKKFPNVYALNHVATPSLQEVIRAANRESNNTIRFQIEIKTSPKDEKLEATPETIVPPLLKVLQEEGVLDRTEIHSFDWRNLMLIKKLEPHATISFISEQSIAFNTISPFTGPSWTAGYNVKDYDNSVPKIIAALGGKIWCPAFTDLTKERVSEAHRYNIKVVPWTVDSTADMNKIIDMGVDGIITNYPHVLFGIRTAREIEK